MLKSPAGMVLAAGFGTRLKPLTDIKPKPLMEIAGKPIIFYLLNNLIKAGVRDIYINLHYESEQIIKAVNYMNLEANINFSLEETILGTAGGVKRVINKFGLIDREMVVINGDIWCELDIGPLLESDNFATLVCAQERSVEGYVGGVAIDENDLIVELGRFYHHTSSKPTLRRGFFTGVHILSPQALNVLSLTDKTCLVSELYPQWLRQKKSVKAHMALLPYEDLGSPDRFLKANLAWVSGIRPPVHIDPTAIVEAGAQIGANVIIGAHARIKKGAIIKNSVVMSDTVIEKDERLDCAIALLDARVRVEGCDMP